MILGAVRQAVKQEVDTEEQETPRCASIVGANLATLLLSRVEGEDGHTEGYGRNNEVLVERIATAEDGDMEEHDG